MKNYSAPLFLIILLSLTIFMIINPRETVKAAGDGFTLWYSVIVPAILPFFIVSELLISMGFVKLLGFVLEPIMRPVFRLPGSSSLVIAMGFTSGFPVGAVLSKRLYDENMLTGEETERLVAFTNNSSPLFIIGAVGVGMLNSPQFGYLLALSHYTGNLLVGLLWRWRADRKVTVKSKEGSSWAQAWQEVQKNSSKGVGHLLGDAVRNSIGNTLAIAGFIIFFSVLGRMLAVCGVLDLLAHILVMIFSWLNVSYPVAYGMSMGLCEITIGAKTIAAAGGAILPQLLVISILLAFSGFSIIAQVMSVVADAPVKLSFYLLSRMIQASIAGCITYWGYKLFLADSTSLPALGMPYYKILYGFDAWTISFYCMMCSLLILLIMILIRYLVID